MSDDYFSFACYKLLNAKIVRVIHLGNPDPAFPVRKILTRDEVGAALGFTFGDK